MMRRNAARMASAFTAPASRHTVPAIRNSSVRDSDEPAEFIRQFAHDAVDAGAQLGAEE